MMMVRDRSPEPHAEPEPLVAIFSPDETLVAALEHAVQELAPAEVRFAHARDRAEFRTSLRLLQPRAIVLDDGLSFDPGYELVDNIREALPDVPILYLASHHTVDLEREVRKRGILLYLAKPTDSSRPDPSVVGTIVRLLGATAAARSHRPPPKS